MIIRRNRKNTDSIWVSYPSSTPILTESDISFVLMQFTNNHKEDLILINELIDMFDFVLTVKKGRTNEVVCKGSEILESILQEHEQQLDVERDESLYRIDSEES